MPHCAGSKYKCLAALYIYQLHVGRRCKRILPLYPKATIFQNLYNLSHSWARLADFKGEKKARKG